MIILFFGIANVCLYYFLKEIRFHYIVIHHTASPVDNYQSIKKFHIKSRGWKDAAYHLILSNGSTEVPAGYLEATGRYQKLAVSVATRSTLYNLTGIHLAIVGNYETHEVPENIAAALSHVIQVLQKKFNIKTSHVLMHRECSPTLCPGKYITLKQIENWLKNNISISPDVIKQHQDVLQDAQLSQDILTYYFKYFVIYNALLVIGMLVMGLCFLMVLLFKEIKQNKWVATADDDTDVTTSD